MHPMSGYGRGGPKWRHRNCCELKATNNRFREVQYGFQRICPRKLIKKHIAKHIHRGRVDVYVRRERAGSGRRVVNLELAEQSTVR